MKSLITSDPNDIYEVMYEILIGKSFDRIKSYINDSYDSLVMKKSQMLDNFKQELEIFPDGREITNWVYTEHIENYERRFVGILMNSTFSATYGLFEDTFKEICFFAEKRYRLSKSVFDIKINGDTNKSYIAKCKKYIQEVAEIDLSSVDQYWAEIDMHRKLRNSINHESAEVDSKDVLLTNYIRSHPLIGLLNPLETRNTTFYIKDKMYIIGFCDLAHDYLTHTLHELILNKPIDF